MTQNIYDDPAFFEAYSRLERSVEGLEGAAEWPALRALLPPLHARDIIDLGCGYGWFCRWARLQGAAHILGLDVSEKMLAHAVAMTAGDGITYRRADLEQLDLPPNSVDLAYSSLAFHYIEDLAGLLARVRRGLRPGGQLVFSMEHPLLTAPRRPEWIIGADGHRTWPVERYLDEGSRTTDWLAPGVIKRHRTVATVLNLLIAQAFVISHVEEWGPSLDQVAARPAWLIERERPMFLLVAART